jgi:hypothetical protein
VPGTAPYQCGRTLRDGQDRRVAAERLKAMGGAAVIYDTTSRSNLRSDVFAGLRHNGQLIVVEGEDPLQVNGHDISWWRNEIKGWYSGVGRSSFSDRLGRLFSERP